MANRQKERSRLAREEWGARNRELLEALGDDRIAVRAVNALARVGIGTLGELRGAMNGTFTPEPKSGPLLRSEWPGDVYEVDGIGAACADRIRSVADE